jgi:Glycosyl hydrolase family 3 N terminal domain
MDTRGPDKVRESIRHTKRKVLMNTSNNPSDLNKVGQHFLIGLQKSVQLTDHDVRLLTTLRPAGIILFRDNFKHGAPYEEWLSCLRDLIESARDSVQGKPLLISIDHECGAVFRPPPPITNFGPAAKWAKKSAEVGTAVGIELRSLGINLNYAPVVDIHTARRPDSKKASRNLSRGTALPTQSGELESSHFGFQTRAKDLQIFI